MLSYTEVLDRAAREYLDNCGMICVDTQIEAEAVGLTIGEISRHASLLEMERRNH